MGLAFVKGDLFATPGVHIIAHGVNLKGAFGAGVAGQIGRKFPWAKKDYLRWVKSMQLGDIQISVSPDYKEPSDLFAIVHLATQHYPGADARLPVIIRALIRLDKAIIPHEDEPTTLALPPIGCGIGGLLWQDVKPVIKNVFANSKLNILVFEEYIAGQPAFLEKT